MWRKSTNLRIHPKNVHPLHKPTRKPTGQKPRDCPPKAARQPQEDCCPHWVSQRLRCILTLPVRLNTRLLVQVVARKSRENKKKEKKPHGGYVVCTQQINRPAVLCRLHKLSIINHWDISIFNIHSDVGGRIDPLWHSASVGEIFHTDGVLRKETYCRPQLGTNGICFDCDWYELRNWYHHILEILDCYTAINSSGKKACKYPRTLASSKNFPIKPFIRSYLCTWVHT